MYSDFKLCGWGTLHTFRTFKAFIAFTTFIQSLCTKLLHSSEVASRVKSANGQNGLVVQFPSHGYGCIDHPHGIDCTRQSAPN